MNPIALPGGRWVNPVGGHVVVTAKPERSARLSGAGVIRTESLAGGPLTEDFVASLWREGFDTAGLEPFHYRYQSPLVEGAYRAMPHQLATAAFLSLHRRAYCTSTMRTGKTGAVTLALDYLRRIKGEAGAALIVAPLSVLEGVWLRTLRLTLPWATAVVVHGSTDKRRELLRRGADYFILNFEGIHLLLPELKEMVRTKVIGSVVFDELTHYGNESSRRWKAANELVNQAGVSPRVWGLTGTPGGNFESVFGYSLLVNAERMPYRRRSSWRDAGRVRFGSAVWQWRDRAEAPRLIQEVMQPCVRFTKEQVLNNLPPVMRLDRRAELSAEQERALRELKAAYRVRLRQGESVTIQQQSALVGKIFQLSLGAVIGDQGRLFLDSAPRIKELVEIVGESDRKTVIFRSFTGALDDLVEKLRAAGLTCEKVDGSVGRRARDTIFHNFQTLPEPRVLVAHPATTAYGVELAAADQLVFDGPPLSGVHAYLQAVERPLSAKQTAEKVSIIQLTATAEERKFFESLNDQRGRADAVAELFTFFLKG